MIKYVPFNLKRSMKCFLSLGISMMLAVACLATANGLTTKSNEPPNVVIIFADDLGYGDIGAYGAKGFDTPNLDSMAVQGIRFTNFYVPAPVCTPSRAALLVGAYPKRLSLAERVIFPYSKHGLHPAETTIAEMLKTRGYATGIIGKWHLGHEDEFLPTRQGFDYFFGLPYSNDMGGYPYGEQVGARERGVALGYSSPPLPLMRNETVIESSPNQNLLIKRFTEESLNFISRHKHKPFFLYMAHTMPHVPIAVSDRFRGQTKHGPYGDAIAEMDWATGQILEHLKTLGLEKNTLVIFTSDNGPQDETGGWVWTPDNDGWPTSETVKYPIGSAGPFKGNKNSTWEGGVRVPMIAVWPGRVPSSIVSTEMATVMDFMPTIAHMTGGPFEYQTKIDGRDISALLFNEPGAKTPHESLLYYRDNRLQAVRSGDWKLHTYRPEWANTELVTNPNLMLFNLGTDLGESRNVASEYPEVVRRLQKIADKARKELGDAVTGETGENVRQAGYSGS